MAFLSRLNDVTLFLPVSNILIFWYLLVILFTFSDLALTVIVTCFQNKAANVALFDVINYILPIILLADIFVEFNTGFIKNGKIILQRKPANIQYMKSIYFYTDFLSFLMSIIQIILIPTIGDRSAGILNYIVFIKLIKTIYFDSIFKKYVIKSFVFLLYYEMLKNFILLTLVCHIIGSFYFYIDVVMYRNQTYSTERLWIFSSYCYQNIYFQEFWVQYTYSFYFACVTLSGTAYGDLIPLNPIETAYVFGCFVFPMLLYAYVFSSIFNALSSRRKFSAQIRKYKFLTKEYLKSLGVNYKVLNKILTYMEFTYRKNMVVDTSFVQNLAPTIRDQYLYINVQGKFDYNICFGTLLEIAHVDMDYLKDKIYKLIKQQYFPERISLITSEKLKLYYINKGKIVEVVCLNNKKLSKPIKHHQKIVGMISFYMNQTLTEKFKYQSNSFVICHSLDYKEFRSFIKQKMPTVHEAFCLLQSKSLYSSENDFFQQNCYFCDENSHMLRNCPYLSPNRTLIVEEKQQFKQERIQFNRDKTIKKSKILSKPSLFMKVSTLKNSISKGKKNKKIYISDAKKVEGDLLNLFLDREFYEYLSQFNVKHKNFEQQTDKQQFNQINYEKVKALENLTRQDIFERVCIWEKYYPQNNIY